MHNADAYPVAGEQTVKATDGSNAPRQPVRSDLPVTLAGECWQPPRPTRKPTGKTRREVFPVETIFFVGGARIRRPARVVTADYFLIRRANMPRTPSPIPNNTSVDEASGTGEAAVNMLILSNSKAVPVPLLNSTDVIVGPPASVKFR